MTSPPEVRHPSMRQRWDKVAFMHWRYDSAGVGALLPDGIEVDPLDGDAWVSLVAFVRAVSPPRLGPAVPWLSIFLETHVRTYVRGPDGAGGIWFLSLDTDRLTAAMVGRRAYRLPYHWSRLRLETAGDVVVYKTRRRRPSRPRVHSEIAVEVGEPIPRGHMGAADRFLTDASRAYVQGPRGIGAIDTAHEPWNLHRASVLHIDDGLVAATGLSPPATEPVAHYSGGTEAQVSHRIAFSGDGGRPRATVPVRPRPAFPAGPASTPALG